MDMGSIGALIGSIATAGEIAKGMINLRDTAKIQEKVIELQGVIMSAQSSAMSAQTDQFALLDRVRKLEKEVADFKAWETEKQRYELKELRPGAFVYSLKEETRNAELPHYICANCYQRGQKSILQQETHMPGLVDLWACQACGKDVIENGTRHNKAGRR